ncbi:MAG: hypothetical protein K0R00_904 [Herbinix sp.]|jgi:DNA-binding PadR family transcriptional regulator|nr:hypothetical protein [Herbinix sp.]
MKIKALTSFSGAAISMGKNEVTECNDKVVLQDLLRAGYIEIVDPTEKEITTVGQESQEDLKQEEDPANQESQEDLKQEEDPANQESQEDPEKTEEVVKEEK